MLTEQRSLAEHTLQPTGDMTAPATNLLVPDVHRHRIAFVNVFFVGTAACWVLVDAGLRGSSRAIRAAAARLFGTRPEAIVLTHGHFDHVGALRRLVALWDVPVYVHALELPYVTGRLPYPRPDPSVGGGLMSVLSPLYPRGPIDMRGCVEVLPDNGFVPGLPDWRWLHTPGHTDGHIALFRERDRTLISGDAVVTTRQESLVGAITQYKVVWRPPAYYTTDWNAARQSVRRLARLEPEVLATGHGQVMAGPRMRHALHYLADNFDSVMPRRGVYVPAHAAPHHSNP